MKALLTTCTLLIGLGLATSAYAHHSMNGFDRAKTITIKGTVKQFKWANPHSWLEVEVPNAKGGSDVWNLEMNPPSFLIRAGWKSTSVKPGDKIKFSARPFKNGDPGGIFVSVTLADGKVLAGSAPRGGGGAAATTPYPEEKK